MLQDSFLPPGLGWCPDPPDPRDRRVNDSSVEEQLARLVDTESNGKHGKRSRRVDLREYFPPAGHQQGVHCSCSFACVGLAEYFQRRWLGQLHRLSVRFVYDVTRLTLGVCGNVATDLRSTLKSMANLGIPPERIYRFDGSASEVDSPPPLAFGLAQKLSGFTYFRLLDRGVNDRDDISILREWLDVGIPFVFAFCVPESITADEGVACRADQSYLGGQAVVAVGYDDKYRVLGCRRGAILFRNSWGSGWGDQGYGWLAYDFFEFGLVCDFWGIMSPAWLHDES